MKRYDVPEICNEWLDDLRADRKSPNTIKSYSHDLKLIYSEIQQNKGLDKIDIDAINYISIRDYKNVIHKEDASVKTINRRIKTIRSFYNWLSINNLIDMQTYNISKNLPPLKVPSREINVFTDEDIQNLFEATQLHENKERNLLIMKLLINTGCRLSELINIEIGHIQNNKISVIGKGNKERKIFLSDSCLEAINNYLKVRPKCDSNILLLTNTNKKFTQEVLSHQIGKWIEVAGIDREKFHAHSCRAFFATTRLKVSSIDEVQALLGHTNIQTTKMYAKTSEEKLEQGRNLVNY